MQNKKKGKGGKGGQEQPAKGKQPNQGENLVPYVDGKEVQKSPEELMQMQADLMSKLKAMKEMMSVTGKDGGLNPAMLDDLFKGILGDMNGTPQLVERQKYIDSEEAHQEFMGEVDHTLERTITP